VRRWCPHRHPAQHFRVRIARDKPLPEERRKESRGKWERKKKERCNRLCFYLHYLVGSQTRENPRNRGAEKGERKEEYGSRANFILPGFIGHPYFRSDHLPSAAKEQLRKKKRGEKKSGGFVWGRRIQFPSRASVAVKWRERCKKKGRFEYGKGDFNRLVRTALEGGHDRQVAFAAALSLCTTQAQ